MAWLPQWLTTSRAGHCIVLKLAGLVFGAWAAWRAADQKGRQGSVGRLQETCSPFPLRLVAGPLFRVPFSIHFVYFMVSAI